MKKTYLSLLPVGALVSRRLPPYNPVMENETEKPLDPVADFILATLAESGSAAPVDIARALGEARKRTSEKPDAWRRFMNPVKQQMIHLARAGRIEITRKGVVVDPEDFRGVVRMRLAGAKPQEEAQED